MGLCSSDNIDSGSGNKKPLPRSSTLNRDYSRQYYDSREAIGINSPRRINYSRQATANDDKSDDGLL